ncbi:hypothetical protein J5X84_19860 [Streptosporangiaceae bacterium NEAU-GS5]|nr:hypothetical protein [Streptosporangiaceae bacterium NEAU-GS5]
MNPKKSLLGLAIFAAVAMTAACGADAPATDTTGTTSTDNAYQDASNYLEHQTTEWENGVSNEQLLDSSYDDFSNDMDSLKGW